MYEWHYVLYVPILGDDIFPIFGDELLKSIGKQVPLCHWAPQRGHWDRMRPQQGAGRGDHLRRDATKKCGKVTG